MRPDRDATLTTRSQLGIDVDGTGSVTIAIDFSAIIKSEGAAYRKTVELGISMLSGLGDGDSFYVGIDQTIGSSSFSDTLLLTFDVDGPAQSFISIETLNTGRTFVPVPAAAWLLLSGLGAFGFMRKR